MGIVKLVLFGGGYEDTCLVTNWVHILGKMPFALALHLISHELLCIAEEHSILLCTAAVYIDRSISLLQECDIIGVYKKVSWPRLFDAHGTICMQLFNYILQKQYLPAIIQLAHKTNIQSKPKHINCKKIHKTQPVK